MAWQKLEKGAEEKILAFVSKEPEVNLFISGDLLNFGIDQKHVRLHSYEKDGAIEGLLLRYMKRNYVFYTRDPAFPFAEVADLIRQDNPTLKGVSLSGKSQAVRPLLPYLSPLKLEETMMARCNHLKRDPVCPEGAKVRALTSKEDFQAFYALEHQIVEFASSDHGEKDQVDSLLADKKRGAICLGVYVGDVLVSVASTTADTTLSSMLVGVCTHPDYRGKGYASLVVSSLLKNRFEKSEQFVCLFYDNPLAGRIYHALGFEDVASYAILN
jgi:predicted GNAT family acetyltransferase